MRSIFILFAVLAASPALAQSRIPPGDSWGTIVREELSPSYRTEGTLRIQREATGWRFRIDCHTRHDSYDQSWDASAWGRATISGDTVSGTAEGGSQPRSVIGRTFRLRLDARGAEWVSNLPSCPQRAQGVRKAR
ncbi:hypothetical protein VQ03_05375 [Methylobacterium tarhaniae]|uniref:Uncharacterized protein n=1 Tax=Methylobacterium tarhaniae TaxID=1187852 RepID=A0A0J6TDT1_9HYPH|nr:hypothetical protein [Methylobacterium tarhaniae]KMO44012.1 hypothetical protein VQ03_05375 [Methylobacterium tarhaniae]